MLRDRTIQFTYVDRTKDFDYIEWELDNGDGRLTRIEDLALGLDVQMRMGYIDQMFPWKSFVINRVRGGVGIDQESRPSVGENESKVTFFGRNRNAPGGGSPSRMSWKSSAKSYGNSRRRKKHYPPTRDVTGDEFLIRSDKSRVIPNVQYVSDAVRIIAEKNGFQGDYAKIEQTYVPVPDSTVEIPPGVTPGTWLQQMARAYGFIYKIGPSGLRWHSRTWPGAKYEVVDNLVYGAGPDIITLDIDADFKLPVPSKVDAKGWDPKIRAAVLFSLEAFDATNELNAGIAYFKDFAEKGQDRNKTLTRPHSMHVVGDKNAATMKAQKRFIEKHLKAFLINLKVVGNPRLLATYLVNLSGTHNRLIDRTWQIGEARHTFGAEEYITELKLHQPPKNKEHSGGIQKIGLIGNPEQIQATTKLLVGGGYFSGPASFMQEKPPPRLR